MITIQYYHLQNHSALLLGATTYIGSLMLLNNLRKLRTMANFTISSITSPRFSTSQLNQKKFITPVTSDRLPVIDELKMKPFYVGSRLNVKQFITLQQIKEVDNVQKKVKNGLRY